MTGYTCPVCGYPGLDEPPWTPTGHSSFEICASCGFEFGYTDDLKGFTYSAWRAKWVDRGMPWDSLTIEPPPSGWDPARQLAAFLASDLNRSEDKHP